jgi:hypothetical protein
MVPHSKSAQVEPSRQDERGTQAPCPSLVAKGRFALVFGAGPVADEFFMVEILFGFRSQFLRPQVPFWERYATERLQCIPMRSTLYTKKGTPAPEANDPGQDVAVFIGKICLFVSWLRRSMV